MKQILKDPMYRFLITMAVCSAAGLHTWNTLFNNFAVELGNLDGDHIGVIQSVREIPGFLALLAVYVLLVIKEHRLSALSILILGFGVGITGFFPSFEGLMITTLIMSFGFHYYETTASSLTLQYFSSKTSPYVFGKVRSIGAASNIIAGLIIYFLASVLEYRQIFLLVGIIILMVGIWGMFQNPSRSDIIPQKKKMVLKRKYSLYYFLTFMAGARRQIFIAFAVFLLVKKFNYTVQEITLLLVVNNVVNFFLSPYIGKAIIRFGERKVLTLEYFSLILVFISYGITQSRWLVACLFVLDHIFFNFAIAINTYFQKVGDPKDIAPTMAVGFTINHIAAVFLPALGGLLWMVNYKMVFFSGALMSFISLLAVQKIRVN